MKTCVNWGNRISAPLKENIEYYLSGTEDQTLIHPIRLPGTRSFELYKWPSEAVTRRYQISTTRRGRQGVATPLDSRGNNNIPEKTDHSLMTFAKFTREMTDATHRKPSTTNHRCAVVRS